MPRQLQQPKDVYIKSKGNLVEPECSDLQNSNTEQSLSIRDYSAKKDLVRK